MTGLCGCVIFPLLCVGISLSASSFLIVMTGCPDSPPIMQGLSASCIYVGSSDPVRVLRLSHNKYTGYTLKHLLLRHMYNLPVPKLHATLLVDPLSPESTNELTPHTVLYNGLNSELV